MGTDRPQQGHEGRAQRPEGRELQGLGGKHTRNTGGWEAQGGAYYLRTLMPDSSFCLSRSVCARI